MTNFKAELFRICSEIGDEFNGWSFISGVFKNKTLKHTDLIISPGFGFERETTPLQPSVQIFHKKSAALFKSILGYSQPTSIVKLQTIAHSGVGEANSFKSPHWIVADKRAFFKLAPSAKKLENYYIELSEAKPILRLMLKIGIEFIESFFNFDTEREFLLNLPPRYNKNESIYEEFEAQKGVMMCLIHAYTGDLSFLNHYISDDFKTLKPKRIIDLSKLQDYFSKI